MDSYRRILLLYGNSVHICVLIIYVFIHLDDFCIILDDSDIVNKKDDVTLQPEHKNGNNEKDSDWRIRGMDSVYR